jgi:hypothetical protein
MKSWQINGLRASGKAESGMAWKTWNPKALLVLAALAFGDDDAEVIVIRPTPTHAYLIERQMKQLGRLDRYQKELAKITRARNIPSDGFTPDQRCRAAIKAMGQYGQVIPLNRSRKQPQRSAEK